MLALNPTDQTLYEWFLAVDARALLGDFGLVTDRLNAPDGVNLMAQHLGHRARRALRPGDRSLFGAPVTFALLVAANLAGTAIAWYLLFTRRSARAGSPPSSAPRSAASGRAWSRSPTATCT